MSASILTWHYGLMAEYWAEFKNDAPEIPYYLDAIRRFGEPVLDLGCGTGRILLPLLRAGIDADGSDVSADMLRFARESATREGFAPHLVAQPMHEFDLPRRYRTIIICGSFGLGVDRDNDLECLRRCHAQLEPGGALIFNLDMEYAARDSWDDWLRESRTTFPNPWPERGAPRIARDGSEHFMQIRMLDVDPFQQTYTREVRLEKWAAGKQIASESYLLGGNLYLSRELLLMLRMAGFSDVQVQGNFTADAATALHEELVFTAVR
ncbi:MAG: class I SAM-dependent methyltransferase [Burkholderiaceae bacterium]